MALNFFQKFSQKKGTPKASVAKKEPVVNRKTNIAKISSESAQENSISKTTIPQRPHEKNILASQLLVAPHVSEKASLLQEDHGEVRGPSYTFRVANKATKLLLKKTIEDRYDVKVISVRVINTHSKEVRRGKVLGHKPGYKKAIITLKSGNIIEQF